MPVFTPILSIAFFFFFDILLISLPFLLQFVNIFLTIVETIHQKILQLQASFI